MTDIIEEIYALRSSAIRKGFHPSDLCLYISPERYSELRSLVHPMLAHTYFTGDYEQPIVFGMPVVFVRNPNYMRVAANA